jgi:predicted RNase H-like nuclease
VGGLDGCSGGWVLATVPARRRVPGPDVVEIEIVPSVEHVIDSLDADELACVAVDIPIGLAACDPRVCDREARRRLGPRRSSVFPAPARAVLAAHTYEEACAVSREVSGKALSKQLYNIVAKIKEVDAVQSPRRQHTLFEACPELSFAVMRDDAPMQHSKHTADGLAERVAVLHEQLGADVAALLEARTLGARPHDVLDALALAWTARRYLQGSCLRLGGGRDPTGLRMEVVA